uniref:Caspase recruitment domain family, member 14 n=1 Tax=Seriola dumerili TaxID=41447 RepID=A0A3B4TE05_SERDU
MAGECVPCEGPDLKNMGEEELWELINDNRHRISLGVRPCIVIPYLRQARVLTEMDEDEIVKLLSPLLFTGYMLDLLRTQGRNGAVALLESLMIHYPTLYTQVTGRKPSTEPSRFSGLIKYSELTEYLVRAVTGMQRELQEAHREASRMTARCASLESEIGQIMEQEEKSRSLQADNEHMRRHLCSLQREVTKLKDEKCDLYVRYTAAIEEKSAVNKRLHDLNLQVSDAHYSLDEAQAMIAQTLAEKDALRCQLMELQERVFSLRAKHSSTAQQQSSDVISHTNTYKRTRKYNTYSNNDVNTLPYVYVKGDGGQLGEPELQFLSRTSAPPFLMRSRPKAIRINGRVLSISFQGGALLSQLAVVGGNKTGVFVHQVTEGSASALRMVLEDSTLEEAMWALGQVTGLCHLSLRPRQDDYEALLQQLQSSEISSGDSFYVRVNMSLPAGPNGTLAVSCNDILHVTNTRPAGTEDSWHASQVHPCQLLDLQSGTLPNYYRSAGRVVAQNKQNAVRIVSTGRQGRNPLWVSVEDEKTKSTDSSDTSAPKSCVTLMPYTLVTPHYPPICRPILLLPTVLGRILDKKLAGWQGFQLCEPGKKYCGIHCVLPLGLDCVRRLHRAAIFPIIIFISQTARSARKLRSKLQRHGQSEEQLLACSKSEEPLLDKLPCLYHSVASDSWCDQTSLLTSLRTIIWEEQKKIVWVEPDLW